MAISKKVALNNQVEANIRELNNAFQQGYRNGVMDYKNKRLSGRKNWDNLLYERMTEATRKFSIKKRIDIWHHIKIAQMFNKAFGFNKR